MANGKPGVPLLKMRQMALLKQSFGLHDIPIPEDDSDADHVPQHNVVAAIKKRLSHSQYFMQIVGFAILHSSTARRQFQHPHHN